MDIYLLLFSLGLSMYLVGVHWTFQLVHFPLYTRVGTNEFQDYQALHQQKILWSVRIPRMIALLIAIALILLEPWGLEKWELWAYFGCLSAATAISFQFIRPLQGMLSQQGYSTKVITTMTRLHWARTILSTAGALILLIAIARLLNKAMA
ncbi:MAG: hypothetical protein NWR72_19000 [Bacteroidia bacterium]|nr:hypothetical protein [Bacteroidia bacterium]